LTSLRRERPGDGSGEMAERMEQLARDLPEFPGLESAGGPDGLGITLSYWATPDDVAAGGRHAEHLLAQKLGREEWYEWFALRVCRVERDRIRAPEAGVNSTPTGYPSLRATASGSPAR
jgi:heme-degrading monooxygenase HmoA